MDFETIDEISNKNPYGAGFINTNTRNPYGNESFYFSLATGRKVGVKSEYYKGLYKDKGGEPFKYLVSLNYIIVLKRGIIIFI